MVFLSSGSKTFSVVDQVLDLLRVSRHIQYSEAAAKVLAVGDQGELHVGIRDARCRDDGDSIIVQEGLDAGAEACAPVFADEISCGNGIHAAVLSAGKHQRRDCLSFSRDHLKGRNELIRLTSDIGDIDQIGLGELLVNIVRGIDIEAQIVVIFDHVAVAHVKAELAGRDDLAGKQLLVHHVAFELFLKGKDVALVLEDLVVLDGLAVIEGDDVSGVESGAVLYDIAFAGICLQDLQDLGLRLAGGSCDDPDVVSPGAGVLRFDLKDLAAPLRALCVTGSDADDKRAGTAVHKELVYRVRKEPVISEGILREVPAIETLEIRRTRHQLRDAAHGSLRRETDKSGRTGPDTFHRLGTGLKLFYIYAW